MPRPKTHFEQVPLELVKKLVDQEIRAAKDGERSQQTKSTKWERDPFEASSFKNRVGQS